MNPEVLALAEAILALPPGEAVFDLDGTLIHGDVGEAALRRARPDKWDEYRALASYRDQCKLAAEWLAGNSVRQLEAMVDDAFATGELLPVETTCWLAAKLAEKHRVWILTGSAEVLGRIVAPRVGVRHVLGLRLSWDGDRVAEPAIEPITCQEGKVRAVWTWLGRRPVFAIGDSPHDLPILRMAHVARTCGKNAGVEFPALPSLHP